MEASGERSQKEGGGAAALITDRPQRAASQGISLWPSPSLAYPNHGSTGPHTGWELPERERCQEGQLPWAAAPAGGRCPRHRVQMGKLRHRKGESLAADPSEFRTQATWCPSQWPPMAPDTRSHHHPLPTPAPLARLSELCQVGNHSHPYPYLAANCSGSLGTMALGPRAPCKLLSCLRL